MKNDNKYIKITLNNSNLFEYLLMNKDVSLIISIILICLVQSFNVSHITVKYIFFINIIFSNQFYHLLLSLV